MDKLGFVVLTLAVIGTLMAPIPLLGQPLTCDGEVVTIVGTEGDDVIVGTPGDDVIHGLGGIDNIEGRGGNDIICGGLGDDTLLGHGLLRDQDGVGATFTQGIIIPFGLSLGVAGTVSPIPIFVAAGPGGTLIGIFADAAGEVDSVQYAVNFEAPSTATCTLT